MDQGSNGGWKNKSGRSFCVLMPAYFHQQKEFYLYIRVEKNSVETESYFTWFSPCDRWLASGMNSFYQLPVPSHSSDPVDCNSTCRSGHGTCPSLPCWAHRCFGSATFWWPCPGSGIFFDPSAEKPPHLDATLNVEVTHTARSVSSGNQWTVIQSPSPPPGNIIFHTENNQILPRPWSNILKLFEVKENNCLLGKRM